MRPILRLAQAGDLSKIVALLSQLSLDEPREVLDSPLSDAYTKAFDAIMADPRQSLLVLEADGSILGTASVVIVPNLSYRGRPYAIIENVVVDAGQRGKGYGELLVNRAVRLARDADCYKVSLTSNTRRVDAHHFYERLGFKATHTGFHLNLD